MARVNRDSVIFEELHTRYGTHVARRVQQGLTPAEFNDIALEDLLHWLEIRAETAHRDYEAQLENPFLDGDRDNNIVNTLYRRWQGAEELAYLIATAENMSLKARVAAGGK